MNALKEKVEKQHELMIAELEKVAQLTKEEAKSQIMESVHIVVGQRHDGNGDFRSVIGAATLNRKADYFFRLFIYFF